MSFFEKLKPKPNPESGKDVTTNIEPDYPLKDLHNPEARLDEPERPKRYKSLLFNNRLFSSVQERDAAERELLEREQTEVPTKEEFMRRQEKKREERR